jgi:AsmA protein
LQNLQVRLDDTVLKGHLTFIGGDSAGMRFDVSADQIDLDRYRAPPGGAPGESRHGDPADHRSTAIDLEGTLSVGSVHVLNVDLTEVHVSVAAKHQVTHLFPIEAQIDAGHYSGDITWDERGAVRLLSIDEHLRGVDIAQVLAGGAQRGRLSGRGSVNVKGSGRGTEMNDFVKSFSGHLDANLASGALEGVDLGYELSRAQALIDRGSTVRQNTRHTTFDTFETSAQITNGVAATRDLSISSEVLKVTGQGSANLATKAINFQLLASLRPAPGHTLIDVPFKVAGTYADPSVSADIDGLAKDQLKQKLQDVLKKNGLQGLFSK